VIDLSSRNGTWLNDDQLIPDKPYPFASGSQLRLARLRLFVLYRPVLEARQM
jgi:pSer/pThr/pTyr-binding forkhead associated (FHA) protein